MQPADIHVPKPSQFLHFHFDLLVTYHLKEIEEPFY